MAKFIHSVLASNQAIAADGDQTFDLPVNPLSAVLLHVSPLNNTTTIANYQMLMGLLSAVDNVRVNHLGAAVIDMRGQDAAAMALMYHRIGLSQSNLVKTDNDRRSMVIPILFGRRAYLASECFPKTKRGELQLTITFDIADTGFDGLRMSIETVELPEAEPQWVEKKTSLVQTFAATGINEVDLPIGNMLRGVLLFGTTGFAGAVPVPTIAEVELLLNNTQTHYTHSDWEVLRQVAYLGLKVYPGSFEHTHSYDDSITVAAEKDTKLPAGAGALDELYALMDLDPLRDDTYTLDTKGASRCHLRVTAETANAMRAFPIERVPAEFYTARSGG